MNLIKGWAVECEDFVLAEDWRKVEEYISEKLSENLDEFIRQYTSHLNEHFCDTEALCLWFVNQCNYRLPVTSDQVREVVTNNFADLVDYLVDLVSEEVVFKESA